MRRHCQREVRRVLGDSTDVDDAVQEALTRAWRHRERCRDKSQPLAWVRQIARNEALRIVQRGAARPAPAELDPPGSKPVASATDHDALLERVDLDRALGRLPAEDRLLVELRYVVDLQQARIARMLEMPEGTVKVRLHRIRKRLEPELA